MDSFDIIKYLDIALRRKYWIIIPFLLSILGGLTYLMIAPKIYEAQTLILVQPQRVPEQFVRSIVSTSVEQRVKTITQQVTSRTNLESIIQEYSLPRASVSQGGIDRTVLELRRKIRIRIGGGRRNADTSTFTISFRGKTPETIAKVTNALASNFISENLRIRESQAMGTSTFLSEELESVKKKLEQKEEELKKYQERYMGALPGELTTNLRILERLQGQLDQLHDSLRDAQNRKILTQAQISEQSRPSQGLAISPTDPQQGFIDIQTLRNQLAALETRYTSKHPDIVRLKETIARMEQERTEDASNPSVNKDKASLTRIDPILKRQLQDIQWDIENFKRDIEKTQSQISKYQQMVEDTPKRAQELLTLNRDYQNLGNLYTSLLNRKLEADISVSMEKKQKGEQFRIIDPAKIPTVPVKPDFKRTILLVLAFGLGLGVGLAYIVEMTNPAFGTPEEVEKELQIPVLVSVPFSYTNKELRNQKVKGFLRAASVAVGFVICAVGIVFATKDIDTTINFAKTFLTNLGVL
jgi:polysaccharide chain length determinant protein (PEP-CTERM system associated)